MVVRLPCPGIRHRHRHRFAGQNLVARIGQLQQDFVWTWVQAHDIHRITVGMRPGRLGSDRLSARAWQERKVRRPRRQLPIEW